VLPEGGAVNPTRFERAVEDLRKALLRRDVRAAVVFGSVARGQAGEDSDLDLLIVPRSRRDEDAVLEEVRRVEAESGVRIAAILASPSLRELERQFLDSILREGKPIVGRMPTVGVRELDLEPMRLVAFDLRDLPQREKVRLERELFGLRTRKRYKSKEYIREVRGKLDEWDGRKIGRGTLLVPERSVSELDALLRAHRAKRTLIPVWVQRP